MRCFDHRTQIIGPGFQLGEVSLAKFLPAVRIVIKPSAQFRAGCDFFEPFGTAERLFPDTTRPQSFHEEPRAVFFPWVVVNALELNGAGHDELPAKS